MSSDPRVEAYDRTARNADELDRLVAARRVNLEQTRDPDATGHSAEAVAQMGSYIELLRLAASSEPVAAQPSRLRLMLKLEFDDGRWDVTEKELDEMRTVGDNVPLADGRMSRVREIKMVIAGRTRKPPRPIVVYTLFV